MAEDKNIPKWEDSQEYTPSWDESSEYIAPEPTSKMDSFIGGATQGATLGFGDEGVGVGETLMDLGHSVLNKLGIVDTPSVTQTNRELAKQGVTGDVGPTTRGDLYDVARDEERARLKELEQANPMSYLGGNIVGGIPTGIATAGALSPLKAAADAGVLAKAGVAAANNVIPGAIAGAGLSEAETIPELAADTAIGAGLGAATGGALNLAGQGLVGAANQAAKAIPQSARDAFTRGRQGVNTNTPEFYDTVSQSTQNKADDIVTASGVGRESENVAIKAEANEALQAAKDKLQTAKDAQRIGIDQQSQELSNQRLKELEALQAKKAQLEQSKKKFNDEFNLVEEKARQKYSENQNKLASKIDELETLDAQAKELEIQKQNATNKQNIVAANREGNKLLKDLKTKVADVRTAASKEYDELDKTAEALGVFPDTRGAISNLEQSLVNTIDDGTAANVLNKVKGYLAKESTPQSYRELKRVLNDLRNHASPSVRNAAKSSEKILRNDYANALGEKSPELADRLARNNNTWGRIADIEDSYLGSLQADRFLDEQSLEKSVGTFKAFKRGDMKATDVADSFEEKLRGLSPEIADEFIPKIQQSLEGQDQLAAFKPNFEPNPEIARLQGLMDQVKAGGKSDNFISPVRTTPEMEAQKQAIAVSGGKVNQLKQMLQDLKASGKQPNEQVQKAALALEDAKAAKTMAGQLDVSAQSVAGTSSPEVLNKQVLRDLPKVGMQTGDDVATKNMADITAAMEKNVGKERVAEILADVPELAKDMNIRNTLAKQDGTDERLLEKGLSLIAGKMTGTGNILGRMARTFSAEEVNINGGLKALSGATPEEQQAIITGMTNMDKIGNGFANVMKQAFERTGVARDAMLFGLMQRPEFRKRMRELVGVEENTEDKE